MLAFTPLGDSAIYNSAGSDWTIYFLVRNLFSNNEQRFHEELKKEFFPCRAVLLPESATVISVKGKIGNNQRYKTQDNSPSGTRSLPLPDNVHKLSQISNRFVLRTQQKCTNKIYEILYVGYCANLWVNLVILQDGDWVIHSLKVVSTRQLGLVAALNRPCWLGYNSWRFKMSCFSCQISTGIVNCEESLARNQQTVLECQHHSRCHL